MSEGFDLEGHWAEIDRWLEKLGRERNRTNFLRLFYQDLPDEWDDEAEEQLPPDLRLVPAPSTPLPH